MKSADVMKVLKQDGWYLYNVRGSNYQFKHSNKKGKITIPHPKSDLPVGTLRSIFRQADIEWRHK